MHTACFTNLAAHSPLYNRIANFSMAMLVTERLLTSKWTNLGHHPAKKPGTAVLSVARI